MLKREEFEAKKLQAAEFLRNKDKEKKRDLAYKAATTAQLQADKFLLALSKREELVLNGRLLTIIFLRHRGKHMISGYIDFAHRLKTEDFKPYFTGQKLLLPKPTDLSYYNWETVTAFSNDSPNFKVDASNGAQGLLFRNKRDRKIINVDPNITNEDNTTRHDDITSEKYE